MNLDRSEGINLVEDVLNKLSLESNIEIIFAPSFVHLYKVAKICSNVVNVGVASQDCSANDKGAFTGEISASMVASCGAQYVVLGHSERRLNFHETNEVLKLKVQQALANNLEIIFCCGETLEQRQNNIHFECIKSQISESLFHLSVSDFNKVIIAYEPIWAIGTGVTASPEQAQEAHAFIRRTIKEKYDIGVSLNTSILYGGSCNCENAVELFAQQDIDGGLIGGASLSAQDFIAITNSF